MTTPKIIVKDYVYLLKKHIDLKEIKKDFTKDHFNNKGCQGCEYKPDRPCDTCQVCENFHGTYKFFNEEEINGKKYVGITKGRTDLLKKHIPSIDKKEVLDLRVNKPMKQELDFILELRPDQVEATKEIMKHRNGLLKAPPRTGKTVMSIFIACEKKQRTLIIAHQDDLLDQFLYTIYGKPPDFPMATNAKKLDEKRLAKGKGPIALIAKKDQDFFGDAEIVMTTWQRFISKAGKKLLKKVAKEFGLVITDEIHKGNADQYSKVLRHFYPRYMYGVTATPERKDKKEFIVDYLLGPIRYESKVKTLRPTLIVQKSALNRTVRAKHWTFIIRALYRDEKRNQDIVDWVMKDLKAGHSILIPATQRNYIQAMVEEINKRWMKKTGSSKPIAEPFFRMNKKQKLEILERARNGETKVIVAMRSMLTGVNVPRWSAIYEISPINNPPNFEQETKRVCTPFEDKKPIIRFFVDMKCNISPKCFLACVPVMQKLEYIIDKEAKQMIAQIRSESSYRDVEKYHDIKVKIGLPGKKLSL